MPHRSAIRFIRLCLQYLLLILIATSCIPGLENSPAEVEQGKSSPAAPTQLPQAEAVFSVDVPAGSVSQGLFIDLLDEVTGLSLNPVRYQMEAKGENHYEAHIPVTTGSVLKYRYVRGGNPPDIERISTGHQVRYRIYSVTGPALIQDRITAWNDSPYQGQSGRIQGRVQDLETGEPLAGILIAAAGLQTYSSGDGSFLIEGVPTGTHTLLAYSPNGSYQPYQQGAVVASESTTPAPIDLVRAEIVKVTFIVHVPQIEANGPIIRMVGNTQDLGNTFADLRGGVSVVASRAPALAANEDGTYSITLNLPAGLDLRYKYTLGDGFWNAEHLEDGSFLTRQLIVPHTDIVIEDSVQRWDFPEFAPVTFITTVPDNTPVDEVVSIQLNPYGWTEPIPMWPQGNNRWSFVLFSPLHLLDHIGYRFCRNDQCGVADDLNTQGQENNGYPFSTSQLPQTFDEEVQEWAWFQSPENAATVLDVDVVRRNANFLTGFEFSSDYHPSWQAYMENAVRAVKGTGSKSVILTPTWSYTRQNLPVLEPVAGKDPSWKDLMSVGASIKGQEMDIILYPQIQPVTEDWWSGATRDQSWWQSWFDRYSTFAIHHAQMAASMQARGLVLGGPAVQPALLGSTLPDGSPSNLPSDAEHRWVNLLQRVREVYPGPVAWALSYNDSLSNTPEFLDQFDMVYLLWSRPINVEANAGQAELSTAIGSLLDEDIKPFKDQFVKPVFIGLSFASFDNARMGCLPIDGMGCQPYDVLLSSSQLLPAEVNLQAQADLYNAFMVALNQREWIDGVISRGFYPPVILFDSSSSTNGKPAYDVLWYWYGRISGENE